MRDGQGVEGHWTCWLDGRRYRLLLPAAGLALQAVQPPPAACSTGGMHVVSTSRAADAAVAMPAPTQLMGVCMLCGLPLIAAAQ